MENTFWTAIKAKSIKSRAFQWTDMSAYRSAGIRRYSSQGSEHGSSEIGRYRENSEESFWELPWLGLVARLHIRGSWIRRTVSFEQQVIISPISISADHLWWMESRIQSSGSKVYQPSMLHCWQQSWICKIGCWWSDAWGQNFTQQCPGLLQNLWYEDFGPVCLLA